MERTLPFPRDSYYCQGAVTPTATIGDELEGKVFKVRDDASPGNEKWLRVVRNASGASITVVAGKLVAFSTSDADDFGCQVSGFLAGSGEASKPLDDLYSNQLTWQSLDLAYVVEKGRCTCPKATGTAITAGNPVRGNASGEVDGSVTTGFIIGICAVSAGANDTTVEVEVSEGFVY